MKMGAPNLRDPMRRATLEHPRKILFEVEAEQYEFLRRTAIKENRPVAHILRTLIDHARRRGVRTRASHVRDRQRTKKAQLRIGRKA